MKIGWACGSMAGAIAFAVAVPAVVLFHVWHQPQVVAARVVAVRAAPTPPAADRALVRPLFSDAVRLASRADALPPLVGIVGRLPDDGVAMVRDEGGTRSIRIGDSVVGWRLISLSSQAAVFERDGERRSVALPTGD